MRVSATGGAVVAVTTLGPQQSGHTAPHFLPDGRRFLFWAGGAPDATGIYLGALDGQRPDAVDARRQRRGTGVYLPPGLGPPKRLAKAGGCCGCERARSWPSGWTWRRPRSRASR